MIIDISATRAGTVEQERVVGVIIDIRATRAGTVEQERVVGVIIDIRATRAGTVEQQKSRSCGYILRQVVTIRWPQPQIWLFRYRIIKMMRVDSIERRRRTDSISVVNYEFSNENASNRKLNVKNNVENQYQVLTRRNVELAPKRKTWCIEIVENHDNSYNYGLVKCIRI